MGGSFGFGRRLCDSEFTIHIVAVKASRLLGFGRNNGVSMLVGSKYTAGRMHLAIHAQVAIRIAHAIARGPVNRQMNSDHLSNTTMKSPDISVDGWWIILTCRSDRP